MNAQQLALAQENVKRGAAWMDENYPGWAHEIDMDVFDMNRFESCIAGQCEGISLYKMGYSTAESFGFYVPLEFCIHDDIDNGDTDYPQLTELWKKEIYGRRAANVQEPDNQRQ